MRVLMIYSTSNLGGAEIYGVNLLRVLKPQVDYTLASPFNSFMSQEAHALGVKSIEVPITYPQFDVAPMVHSVQIVYDALYDNPPDLIHVHHLPAAMVGSVISFIYNVPLLFSIDSPYLRQPYKDFIRSVPCHIMSASISGHAEVIAQEIAPAHRVHIGQPGIPLERFTPVDDATRKQARRAYAIEDDTFVVGVAARLVEDKGVHYVIKAIQQLRDQYGSKIVLLIAGVGPMRPSLDRLIAENHLEASVYFLDKLEQSEMPQFYAALDAFVLPSKREGRPISIMEAIALNVPVVATNVGDVADMIHHGENGYLLRELDATQIANSLRLLIENPDFRRQSAAYNARIRDRLDRDTHAHSIYAIYQRVLHSHQAVKQGSTFFANVVK